MTTKPALVVMTRWPTPGCCKKRLASKIGDEKAAAIQRRLIDHTIAVAIALERKDLVKVQLAITGLEVKKAIEWGESKGIKNIVLQGNGNLGFRMRQQVLNAHKKEKGCSTILIGSDLPMLCERDLIEAIEALEKNEIVIGPAEDGGYWLLGLSNRLLHPVISWPFYGIPWGTNKVLEETLNKANNAGFNHILLSKKNDLDVVEDLSPWQA